MRHLSGLGVLVLCWAIGGCSPSSPSSAKPEKPAVKKDPSVSKAHAAEKPTFTEDAARAWPGVSRGVAWDANWENREHWYGTPAAQKGLDKLKGLGADWIAITPFSFQKDINKPDISFREEWGRGLARDVKNAHDRGIKVMVKPHIWSNQFWDGSGAWRGHIKMTSEADWVAWFDNYTRWIVDAASESAALKADAFCVGLEYLESTRAHADKWREVIRRVREVYDGPLIYAAHESELDLPFWDDLDAIGVNAYYSLSDSNSPSKAEMKANWATIARNLEAMAKRWKRPIVFTEVGYASIDGAARAPFRWPNEQDTEDQPEQASCYQVLFEEAPSWPWFAGMFIWKYKIGVEKKNAAERHYVFQGKQAEAAVKQGFGMTYARESKP